MKSLGMDILIHGFSGVPNRARREVSVTELAAERSDHSELFAVFEAFKVEKRRDLPVGHGLTWHCNQPGNLKES